MERGGACCGDRLVWCAFRPDVLDCTTYNFQRVFYLCLFPWRLPVGPTFTEGASQGRRNLLWHMPSSLALFGLLQGAELADHIMILIS